MIAIGIDPGLTGAIALVDMSRGLLEVADMPTSPNGLKSGSMRRWVAAHGLVDLMREWATRHRLAAEYVAVAMERPIPMPTLPAQTVACQFDTVGAIRGVLAARGWPLTMVEPRAWKGRYGLKADKDESRAACRRLYPAAPIERVRDHNRAEAILIADWLLSEEMPYTKRQATALGAEEVA